MESRAGHGTTMCLRLHLLAPSALQQVDLDSSSLGEAPAEHTAAVHQGHILVADDNEINSEILGCQLRALGLRVDLASDGEEALGKWQSGDYDLIFADCHMPNMDGYELARRIRSLELEQAGSGRIPIVAYTANALSDHRVVCETAGMDDQLIKPVEIRTLAETLARWLPKQE